ncbi:pyruvate kinase [Naumannella huperziae]
MRRAKIVCTLGPASSSPERLRELIAAGMDVARFNMSHGDYPDHERALVAVREAAAEAGRPIGTFADLQGPKIRLGRFGGDGRATLAYGQQFTITTDPILGDGERASTTYAGLPGDVAPGDLVLIDDGRVMLECVDVAGNDVITRVKVGGPISNNKGINLPGVAVNVPAMSDKDLADLRWALRQGFDMIALSFVRTAADCAAVRQVMAEEGRTVPVIAKIEKPQAVQNIDEVIDAFDAIMVARGDLGVELPLEEVPMVQKMIIEKARRMAKPVIVATQMLESMIGNPRPTRAEASDVANAVLDGADAVMLSGETSVGQFPVVAVETMARIVAGTEEQGFDEIADIDWDPHTTGGVIAKVAVEVADRVGAKYVIAFSKSGDTARRVARLRAKMPYFVFTPLDQTRQELTLVWGARSFLTEEVYNFDDLVAQVDETMVGKGLCEPGDKVIVVAGTPVGVPGNTNALRVHKIRDPKTIGSAS